MTLARSFANSCRKSGGQFEVITKYQFVSNVHIPQACSLAQVTEVYHAANFIETDSPRELAGVDL